MSTAEATHRRTYGNWTKPQTPGLGRLGLLGTIMLLGSLVITVLCIAIGGLIIGACFLAFATPLIAPLAYRNRAGRNGWQILATQVGWQLGKRARQTTFVAGRLGPVAFGSRRLPGLLAQSQLFEATDGYGQKFGIIHSPSAGHYSVLIRCTPDGSELVDQDTIDTWVAYYGRFLADLAHEPGLVAAAVTLETAPDPGFALTAEVDRLIRPTSPTAAADVLRAIADSYPRGSADITGRVCLTFSARRRSTEERELGRRGKRQPSMRSADEMATLIATRLSGLTRAISQTGASAPELMTAADIAEMVRIAYDPSAARDIMGARSAGEPTDLTWDNAGPSGAHEGWGFYLHDNAASITWGMVRPPRGAVESSVLEDILRPNDAVDRKRVTILYRPHDSASAADVVDADLRTATGKPNGRVRAHEKAVIDAATQAAREEAAGAGLARFAILITGSSVDDTGIGDLGSAPDRLREMAEAIDQGSRASRLQMRRCYGSQSAAFAAALGIGIIPTAHVAVPNVLRDHL